MAYFYFDFRDTTNKTSAYNVELIRSGQNLEGEGEGHTFAIDPQQRTSSLSYTNSHFE